MPSEVLPVTHAASPPRPPARTLAGTMLLYTVLGVLVVTLAPFEFRAPEGLRIEWSAAGFELAANCALLVVPGFLLRAWTGADRDIYCVVPGLVGLTFALLLEIVQATIPGRCMSPIDAATNAAGAWFGAMLHDSVRRHVDRRAADRLLLELPLMGLVYLLVPMLWLDGFASIGHARRIALALPLGLAGAIVIASVWHHRLRPAKILSPGGAACVAGLWFLVAAAPILRHDAGELLLLALGVTAAARLALAIPGFLGEDGHRFEVPTLRRVAPLFCAYLVVLAFWPFAPPTGAWRAEWGLAQIGHPPSLVEVARLLEWMAAFTLAGYMAAEALGRSALAPSRRLVRVALGLAALAAALEVLRGFAPDTKASALRCVFAVAGATFGAAVYGLQLASIRGWLEAKGAAAQESAVTRVAANTPLDGSVLAEALAASAVPDPVAIPPAGSSRSANAVFAVDD